ncbi:MAG: hypothetical protein QOJ59_2734 [Thermomicrobiales bacterium]|nr:hypothetical protein [Thermomicrobiales bacterium]
MENGPSGLAVSRAGRAGAGLGDGFGVAGTALAGDEVELGLGLLQAEADALLVEVPHVAADGGVDEAELIVLVGNGTDAEPQLAVELVDLVNPLAETFVSLLGGLTEFGELGIGGLPDVFEAIDEHFVALNGLGVEAANVLAEPNISFAQLRQGGVDVDDGATIFLDEVRGMGDVRADFVEAGTKVVGRLRDFGGTAAGLLIHDLDRVFVTEDVTADLVGLAADVVDRVAELVSDNGITVADGGEVLNQGPEFVVTLLVLPGIIGLAAGGFEEFSNVGLEGADGAGSVVETLLEVDDDLACTVLVEGAGLGGLLCLLADGIENKAVLGGVAFVAFDAFFDADLAAGELAQGLAELVELVLEGDKARLVPFAVVVLTIRRDPERRGG